MDAASHKKIAGRYNKLFLNVGFNVGNEASLKRNPGLNLARFAVRGIAIKTAPPTAIMVATKIDDKERAEITTSPVMGSIRRASSGRARRDKAIPRKEPESPKIVAWMRNILTGRDDFAPRDIRTANSLILFMRYPLSM